jgi:hypothetical protein
LLRSRLKTFYTGGGMETINYISDFKFENDLSKVLAHSNYVQNGAIKTLGQVLNLDIKKIERVGVDELSKRKDSRIMLKFNMALDNNKIIKLVELQDFISKKLNVNKNNIAIAEHQAESQFGNENRHAHIIIFPPRDIAGKKLRLTKKDLSDFHKSWKEFLIQKSFTIKENEIKEKHLGIGLRYDKDKQETYINNQEIKELEQDKKQIEKRIKIAYQTNSIIQELPEKTSKEKLISLLPTTSQEKAVLEHFNRLQYNKDDKISILAVNKETGEVKQRALTVINAIKDIPVFNRLNKAGFNIYHSINSLLPDEKIGRLKSDFRASQNIIYLDLDCKNDKKAGKQNIERLNDYIKKYNIPSPNQIVRTSEGNYQVYWVLDKKVEFNKLENIMKTMNKALNLDYTQDISRVFRLPGFINQKQGKTGDKVENLSETAGIQTKYLTSINPFENILKEQELKDKKINNLKSKPLEIQKDISEQEKINRSFYLKTELERKHWIDYKSDDLSKSDLCYALYLAGKHLTANEIMQKIKAESPDIENRHKNIIDYLERTVNKALEYVKSLTPPRWGLSPEHKKRDISR